mmetsp:Transcript_12487/g.13698  ORF Transcript_12487/g.13698 Transcript_12487/m.13698 type:complete len:123 (+) Transcript_12487:587-955(+)
MEVEVIIRKDMEDIMEDMVVKDMAMEVEDMGMDEAVVDATRPPITDVADVVVAVDATRLPITDVVVEALVEVVVEVVEAVVTAVTSRTIPGGTGHFNGLYGTVDIISIYSTPTIMSCIIVTQ